MASQSIDINVSHTIKGSSSPTGDISKNFSSSLDSFNKEVANLSNVMKQFTKIISDKSTSNSSSLPEINTGKNKPQLSDDEKQKQREDKELTKSNRELKKAINEFSKVFVYGPMVGALKDMIGYTARGRALTAGNNLTNPVGFAQAQVQNDYDVGKSITSLIGSVVGGILGAAGGPVGIGVGSYAGSQISSSLYGFINQEDAAQKQLNFEKNARTTSLMMRNQTGIVSAGLYSEMFSNPSLAQYANQIPYMASSNQYRASSRAEILKMAQFGHEQGISGSAQAQLANSIAQIIPYFSSSNDALQSLEQSARTYGGDIIQQTSMMVSLLQQGVTAQDAQKIAFDGYRGEAARQAAASYATSPDIQRIQEEFASNLLGFSTAAYMAGTETPAQKKARERVLHSAPVGASLNFLFGDSVRDKLVRMTGIPLGVKNNVRPTMSGIGNQENAAEKMQELSAKRRQDRIYHNSTQNQFPLNRKNFLVSAQKQKTQEIFHDEAEEQIHATELYLSKGSHHSHAADLSILHDLNASSHATSDPILQKHIMDLTRQIKQLDDTMQRTNRGMR